MAKRAIPVQMAKAQALQPVKAGAPPQKVQVPVRPKAGGQPPIPSAAEVQRAQALKPQPQQKQAPTIGIRLPLSRLPFELRQIG